jgi:PPP family 3-phenylpropionic acid transporter
MLFNFTLAHYICFTGEAMEKLAKQLTVKYAFLQSAYWISECSIYSFAAVYLQYKNFDNTQIGFVLSFAAILSILLQPVIAAIADKTKKVSLRFMVLLLIVIVIGMTLLLYVMQDSFWVTAMVFILINAIQFTLNPLFNSLALEYLNIGIPMNYGLARGTGSICYAVMSYFLGNLVDSYSAGIILPIFLVSYIIAVFAVVLFKINIHKSVTKGTYPENLTDSEISSVRYHPQNETEVLEPEKAPSGIFSFFITYKKFTVLLIGIAMVFYSHSLINTYLINIIKQVGGSGSDLGISLSIAAGLELPTMAVFIYLVRKISCHKLLIISAFFFFIKAVVTWLAPNVFMIYVSQIFQMLSFALYTPASIYYVNEIVGEHDRVKGQAMLGVAALGIAGTAANISGGKILDSLGVSQMLLVGTLVTFLGFLLVCFSVEKTKKNSL